MAPLAPFVSEQMYRNLELRFNPDAPDSVHLTDYPVADTSLIDEPILDATRLAIRVSSMGRAARSKAGLKVRQPLASVVVRTRTPDEAQYLDWVGAQILEELNIKSLRADGIEQELYSQALGRSRRGRRFRGIRGRVLGGAGSRLHGGSGRPHHTGTGRRRPGP